MTWWKTFSAVLAAGLLVFVIYRTDIGMDRAAAVWNTEAKTRAAHLKETIERCTIYRSAESADDMKRLKETIQGDLVFADYQLKNIPSRADSFALDQAVLDAREFLAGK